MQVKHFTGLGTSEFIYETTLHKFVTHVAQKLDLSQKGCANLWSKYCTSIAAICQMLVQRLSWYKFMECTEIKPKLHDQFWKEK